MTLGEIDRALPNGLHDAKILELGFSFEDARLALRIRVWVGAGAQLERYRAGELAFSRVAFLSFESPTSHLAFKHPRRCGFPL